jgi:hypothetical protein
MSERGGNFCNSHALAWSFYFLASQGVVESEFLHIALGFDPKTTGIETADTHKSISVQAPKY